MVFIAQKRCLVLLSLSLLTLGCTSSPSEEVEAAAADRSVPSVAASSSQTTAATPQASEGAIAPGRYCYGIDSADQEGAIRLQIDDNQRVSGDSSVTIHVESEGYYSSYAQKLEGQLHNGQISMDITTWIEYDQQPSQEVWSITPTTLKTERETFTSIGCDAARERFVGPDGLEAADLLDGSKLNPFRVEFKPGTTSTTLENAVVRGERNVYQINARGGQSMSLGLTSLEDNAAFDVISPSGLVLSREGTSETLALPQTGDYQVVVGGTRGNATYTLKVEIR